MNELDEMKNIIGKVRNIKESIQFEDFDMPEFGEGDIEERSPIDDSEEPEMSAEEKGMAELDKMGAIDQIREITLKGMIKLCDSPEHPEYQALLKIFNMCNKAVSDKQNDEPVQK